MADDSYISQWGTVSFGVPDFLEQIRDAANDFAELLITFLEIANQALEFVKAFIKGYLDPMVAIIEAIIAEVVAFLRDLKEIGLYLTGDWALLGWPPEDLRGGYQGYERRMVARLTDRTDPTRPDAPSSQKVLGFFAYLSVDPSDFERLTNFIITITRMFGLSYFPDTSRFPVPVINNVKYGTQALGVGTAFQFRSIGDALGSFNGTPPQKCRITWVTQPASQKHPLNPLPMVGPSGYLVTVSTVPDGIALKYARPRANTDKKSANGDKTKQVQPREFGDVRDPNGQPIKLFGGAEMLSFQGSGFEYNKGINTTTGSPEDGCCQVFGMLDPASNEIIPLEHLGPATAVLGTPGDGKGGDFYLQRTFLITDGVTLAQWFAGEYSAVLDLADMPNHARWVKQSDGQMGIVNEGRSSTYYVRVTSVGKQVADEKAVPQWNFNATEFRTNVWTSGQPFIVDLKSGSASIGNPSTARKVTFVGSNTQEYLKALHQALLVLVLTRADLPVLAELQDAKGIETVDKYKDGTWGGAGVALGFTGLENAKGLMSRLYPDITTLEKPDQHPIKWRTDLYHNIKTLAQELYEKAGVSPRTEKYVVESTPELRALTLGEALDAEGRVVHGWRLLLDSHKLEDPLLFESLNPDNPLASETNYGFAPNMYSTGMNATDVDDLFFVETAMWGREDEFILHQAPALPLVFSFKPKDAAELAAFLKTVPEGLAEFYAQFYEPDFSFDIPDKYRALLTAKFAQARVTSSGDKTPVFVGARDTLMTLDKNTSYYKDLADQNVAAQGTDKPFPALLFTRHMMRAVQSGVVGGQVVSPILSQAALVLQIAAAEKPAEDGEWLSVRLFAAWPSLEEFLRSLENWVTSLAEATRSIADAIIKYIEFLQAQIIELQQLIRRINALIASFLNFSFALPQCSGLMLLSDGTDGILADFVAAKNKPSDPPLSYGAGVALVVPFAPSFILDIITVAAVEEGQPTQDLEGTTQIIRPPDSVGTEGVEPTPGPPPSDEPDVL